MTPETGRLLIEVLRGILSQILTLGIWNTILTIVVVYLLLKSYKDR